MMRMSLQHRRMCSSIQLGSCIILFVLSCWTPTALSKSFLPSSVLNSLGIIKQSKRKEYTPLVFFTTPKDIIPECDAMDVVVRQVEKELGVRVERLDILRDPAAQAVLETLTRRGPPFLYHRESLQTIHVPSAKKPGNSKKNGDEDSSSSSSSSSMKKMLVASISKDRVVAWAKGRYLPALSAVSKNDGGGGGRRGSSNTKNKPIVVSQEEETAIDQKELMDELYLTPLQKSGKEAIQRRTEEMAEQARQEKQQQQEIRNDSKE